MNEENRIRYSRMTSIPEIGTAGMQKIRNAKVMIVGCGALGSVCAMYLAGAGIGKLGIADFDTIDLSNLQRQLFYNTQDVGKSKAQTLACRLNALNPECEVECIEKIITPAIASSIFESYDFVIDATDNPASKLMTDNCCSQTSTPCCIGGVAGFTGQVMSWKPGCKRYSEVFNPQQVDAGYTPCSLGGVFGPAAGIIACCQAAEAIKHITGAGDMLYNNIFTLDLLSMQSHLIEID